MERERERDEQRGEDKEAGAREGRGASLLSSRHGDELVGHGTVAARPGSLQKVGDDPVQFILFYFIYLFLLFVRNAALNLG